MRPRPKYHQTQNNFQWPQQRRALYQHVGYQVCIGNLLLNQSIIPLADFGQDAAIRQALGLILADPLCCLVQ